MESMVTGDVSPSRFSTGSAAVRSSSAKVGALACFALCVAAPSDAAPAVAPARNFLRLTCIPDSLPRCFQRMWGAGCEPKNPAHNPDLTSNKVDDMSCIVEHKHSTVEA